jgi:hypothetical protein
MTQHTLFQAARLLPHAALIRVAILGLLLTGSGCSREEPPRVDSDASTPGTSAQPKASTARDKLVALSEAAIKEHSMTSLASDCLQFEISDDPASDRSLVDVRELHNARCGGDPSTAPRLFMLKIDAVSGAIWTDARSTNGEFERLP